MVVLWILRRRQDEIQVGGGDQLMLGSIIFRSLKFMSIPEPPVCNGDVVGLNFNRAGAKVGVRQVYLFEGITNLV